MIDYFLVVKHLRLSKSLLLIGFTCCLAGLAAQKPIIGIATAMGNDSLVTAAGYGCIIESIGKCISPRTLTDAQFREKVAIVQGLKTPICAFNLFIPGDLKLVGPEVNEIAVLTYAETVIRRVSETGVTMIVWGSGGARRVPDGFDHRMAEQQFVGIARKIADIARTYQIVIALENLNSTETNFINTVADALQIVKKVNRSNFRLNADIYHMLKENEGPAILQKAKKYLVHVEIAEKEGRTPPGVSQEDFRPFLRALHRIKYHRQIVIEGHWENLGLGLLPARIYLQAQIDAVYR